MSSGYAEKLAALKPAPGKEQASGGQHPGTWIAATADLPRRISPDHPAPQVYRSRLLGVVMSTDQVLLLLIAIFTGITAVRSLAGWFPR